MFRKFLQFLKRLFGNDDKKEKKNVKENSTQNTVNDCNVYECEILDIEEITEEDS